MKAAILHGKEVHIIRLINGLKACGIEVLITQSIDIPQADFYFIDATFPYDAVNKLKGKICFLFDCEDAANHLNLGPYYDDYKNLAKAYVKMNYLKDDKRFGLNLIGMPLDIYMHMVPISKLQCQSLTNFNCVPSFIGAPTYIGRYDGSMKNDTDNKFGVKNIGIYDNGELMFNQRYQWLKSLKEYHIPYAGGIVFSPNNDNMNLDWQKKYFGDVGQFACDRITFHEGIGMMFNYKIALCPTGHDRLSWRMYSAMATGSIMFITGFHPQQTLYMPKMFIPVSDESELGDLIHIWSKSFTTVWNDSKKNREVFSSLTPEKMWQDFLKQID